MFLEVKITEHLKRNDCVVFLGGNDWIVSRVALELWTLQGKSKSTQLGNGLVKPWHCPLNLTLSRYEWLRILRRCQLKWSFIYKWLGSENVLSPTTSGWVVSTTTNFVLTRDFSECQEYMRALVYYNPYYPTHIFATVCLWITCKSIESNKWMGIESDG